MEETIDQLKARLERAVCGDAPPTPLLVCGLVERFLTHAARYYPARPNGTSETDNFMDAAAPLLLLYAYWPAERLGPVQLQACRQHMIEQRLARSTINARVRRLRQIFRWGVSMGWLAGTVLHSLEAVKGLRKGRSAAREPVPITAIPMDVIQATLARASPRIGDMSNLQLLTAARPGEICAMRGCEIDRSGEVWLYEPAVHKTAYLNSRRVIVMGPRAIEIAQRYLKPSYMFPSKSGGPFRVTSYETAIRRAALRAGVPHWSPNRLRHTAATLIRQRFGLEAAQAVLGHSKVETAQIYSERLSALAIDAMRRIG